MTPLPPPRFPGAARPLPVEVPPHALDRVNAWFAEKAVHYGFETGHEHLRSVTVVDAESDNLVIMWPFGEEATDALVAEHAEGTQGFRDGLLRLMLAAMDAVMLRPTEDYAEINREPIKGSN